MKKTFKTNQEAADFFNGIDSDKFAACFIPDPNKDGGTLEWVERKAYTENGQEKLDEVWLRQNGEMVQVQDLSVEHARNIIRMILRNQREHQKAMSDFLNQLQQPAQEDGEEQLAPVIQMPKRVLH
jgi:hypothetical protein